MLKGFAIDQRPVSIRRSVESVSRTSVAIDKVLTELGDMEISAAYITNSREIDDGNIGIFIITSRSKRIAN